MEMGKGIHPQVYETQGFLYLGHSNGNIFSLLSWFCPKIFPTFQCSYWGVQFLITPEKGAGNWKRDSPTSEWDTWVSVPGAFILDHLQPVKLILSQNFINFSVFILGPIPYYPIKRGWKWGKGIHPKVNETQRHSNWTICNLSSWYLSKPSQSNGFFATLSHHRHPSCWTFFGARRLGVQVSVRAWKDSPPSGPSLPVYVRVLA